MDMSESELKLPDGRRLPIDDRGYLLDPGSWTPDVAGFMAQADGVDLTDEHWAVIEIVREYFGRFDIEPPMRVLVRRAAERLGDEQGNTRHLYRLFPDGPVIQACRYGGLPRPVSCI